MLLILISFIVLRWPAAPAGWGEIAARKEGEPALVYV